MSGSNKIIVLTATTASVCEKWVTYRRTCVVIKLVYAVAVRTEASEGYEIRSYREGCGKPALSKKKNACQNLRIFEKWA